MRALIKYVQGSGFRVQGHCPQPRTPHPDRARLPGSDGFTFVELLIVGLIVVLVVNGMAWTLASSGRMVWARTDAKMASLTAAQRALDRVSEDLRRASQATVTCSSGQLTFVPATGGNAVTYHVTNGSLVRTQNAVAQPIAAQIAVFTPSCQANGLVRLQFTAQVAMASTANVTRTLDSQVRVQNP